MKPLIEAVTNPMIISGLIRLVMFSRSISCKTNAPRIAGIERRNEKLNAVSLEIP